MLTPTPTGFLVDVVAAPRSSRAGVEWLDGEILKVKVRAAPVDGKANIELIETLADAFGVKKRDVSLVSGATAKHKRFAIAGGCPPARR